MAGLYLALVHHPVRDRENNVVTTSITNIDVHDIARSARTFGARKFFVVTPITKQQEIVAQIIAHWRDGAGQKRIPERSQAIERVRVAENIESVVEGIAAQENKAPTIVATSARRHPENAGWTFGQLKEHVRTSNSPTLLLFGSGHGLHDVALARVHAVLEPISAEGDYNHLSVRAAAAIILDRLRS